MPIASPRADSDLRPTPQADTMSPRADSELRPTPQADTMSPRADAEPRPTVWSFYKRSGRSWHAAGVPLRGACLCQGHRE
jgi:hypothetical protein